MKVDIEYVVFALMTSIFIVVVVAINSGDSVCQTADMYQALMGECTLNDDVLP